MEILVDVVMEKNSLEEKTSLSQQVGVPDPTVWASPPTRGDGVWRTVYTRRGPQADSRHGYQEVCTFRG
jgi:hypothetical protein